MVTRIDGDAIFGNMVTVGAAETLACASAGHRRSSRRPGQVGNHPSRCHARCLTYLRLRAQPGETAVEMGDLGERGGGSALMAPWAR